MSDCKTPPSEAEPGAANVQGADAGEFSYAEDYPQQYLVKNPNGYCGIGGTGQSCPVGVVNTAE